MRTLTGSFLAIAMIVAVNPAFGQTSGAGIQYVIDYDVPESPALVAIGASVQQVAHGGVAKPATARLVNAFQTGDQIASGLALDFSPYLSYIGKVRSVDEYRASAFKRWAANTQVSVATVQDPDGLDSLLFGIGVRMTVFDSHDLLANATLANEISKALAGAANAGRATSDDEIAPGPVLESVAAAYENTRKAVRDQPGQALTFAWAGRSEVRHSVASVDSFTKMSHLAWASYHLYFRAGRGIRTMVQWRGRSKDPASWRGGIAFSSAGASYQIALEGYLDTVAGASGETKFGISGNGEYRIKEGLSLVAAIGSEPDPRVPDLSRIRLRTALRWSYLGESS